LADAATAEHDLLAAWVENRESFDRTVFAAVREDQDWLEGAISSLKGQSSSLTSRRRSLQNSEEAVSEAERDLARLLHDQPLDLAAAERTLREREQALKDLDDGPDPLDLRSQQLSVRSRALTLASAREHLVDYALRAPFDGLVAKVHANKYDYASSGTTAFTLVSKQQTVMMTLNEVDAARVAVGQKAVCIFDALEDVTMTGSVASVDLLGAVSQGVVNYEAIVVFDTWDERIKPGMSTSVSVITDVAQDVLMVPLSAVQTDAGGSWVQVMSDGQPQTRTVEVGLSNDTMVAIRGEVTEGEEVVTQTLSEATASAVVSGGNMPMMGGFGAFRPRN
jgi:multidrug efflux pump subunit AcrA (membrane-fusion protein)